MITKKVKIVISMYVAALASLATACYGSIIASPTYPTSATCDGAGACTTGPWTDGQCGSNSDPSGASSCTSTQKTDPNFPNFVCAPNGKAGSACTQSGTIGVPDHTAKGSGTCGGGH